LWLSKPALVRWKAGVQKGTGGKRKKGVWFL